MDELLALLNVTKEAFAAKWARLSAIDDALTAAQVTPTQLATFLQMGSLLVARDQANQQIAKLQDERTRVQAEIDAKIVAEQAKIEAINTALRPQDT